MTMTTLTAPIDHAPEIAAQLRVLETYVQRRNHLAATLAEYRRRLASPQIEGATYTAEDRLEAMTRVASVDAEHTEAELQVVRLQARLADLRDAERVKRLALFDAERGKAVARLAKALCAARDANEALRRIEVAQHETTGIFTDFCSWNDLTFSSEDGTFNSRLDQWLDAARAHGFLD